MLTKEFIISYLKDYYERTKTIPRAKDKSHPFSDGTLRKYLGSWNNALMLSNIPFNKNLPVQVSCKKCGKEFMKAYNQIKKSSNHFCSHSCSATYSNTNRLISSTHKEKLVTMLNKYREEKMKNKIIPTKMCIVCKCVFSTKNRKTCSNTCKKQLQQISASKGGSIAASIIMKRSKGEIMFANMCKEYFGEDDILCNELLFLDKNGKLWDADIYIKSLRLAVLYDGLWHFKQLTKSHNLKQVQSRDKIKRKIIIDNGCTYYTIKDMGSFNKQFVTYQFNIFVHKLVFTKVLNDLLDSYL